MGGPDSVRDATIIVSDFSDSVICVFPNTTTVYSTDPELGRESDPWSEYVAELEEKESAAQQVRQAYKARIDTLRSSFALDGFDVNESSVRDFWSFIGSPHFSRQAGLALMDNGNLRAVWKGEDTSHLGLHFIGGRQVQYVIFKRRPGSRRVSRTAGIDTFEGVKKQIGAFDLMSLVNA
jgi:hypothetical protein